MPWCCLLRPLDPRSPTLPDLKRVTVGVVGGEINRKVVSALTEEYDLGRANVTFRNLTPAETRRALDAKEVRAILIVVPLAEKYLTLLRGLFLQNPKTAPVLIPIDAAGAIAEKQRAYESFDVPKGTLRGSPPIPGDDLTTLRVSFYRGRQEEARQRSGSAPDGSVMKARRDLLGELPMLAQMTAPSTDSDAYLPVHPGAAAFYNGTQESFLDKWGNAIFLAPMIFGGSVSVLAAAWKFLRDGERPQAANRRWIALRARKSHKDGGGRDGMSEIEREIDKVLQAAVRNAAGDENALDVTTLNVAAHRLQSLIHDRRTLLAARPGDKAMVEVAGRSSRRTRTLILIKGPGAVSAIGLSRLQWRKPCCVA